MVTENYLCDSIVSSAVFRMEKRKLRELVENIERKIIR